MVWHSWSDKITINFSKFFFKNVRTFGYWRSKMKARCRKEARACTIVRLARSRALSAHTSKMKVLKNHNTVTLLEPDFWIFLVWGKNDNATLYSVLFCFNSISASFRELRKCSRGLGVLLKKTWEEYLGLGVYMPLNACKMQYQVVYKSLWWRWGLVVETNLGFSLSGCGCWA